jgi:hypothetical protein
MNHRLHLYASAMLSAWLLVMLWQIYQWQAQESDIAWMTKLAVNNIKEVAVWIAAWAWISHVQTGRARLAEHILVVAGACLFDEVILTLVLPWMFFMFGWPWPALAMKMLWFVGLCLTALMNLKIASIRLDGVRVGLWLAASVTAGLLFFLQSWADDNDSEALKKLPYETNIYPPLWLKTPAADLETGLKELWGKDWIKD